MSTVYDKLVYRLISHRCDQKSHPPRKHLPAEYLDSYKSLMGSSDQGNWIPDVSLLVQFDYWPRRSVSIVHIRSFVHIMYRKIQILSRIGIEEEMDSEIHNIFL